MRFKKPTEGDTRVRKFFAWIPVREIKTGEIRWLEHVTVNDRYITGIGGGSEPRVCDGWVVDSFI